MRRSSLPSPSRFSAQLRPIHPRTFNFYRNDTLVKTTDFGAFGRFPAAAEPADYRGELTVSSGTSLYSTRTVWKFRSQRPAAGTTERLPLLTLDYDIASDLFSQSPLPSDRGGPNTIMVNVGHQAGSSATPISAFTFAVSYDDGLTWKEIKNVKSVGPGAFSVILDERSPQSTTGFVALKVYAADAAGGSIEQTIVHAYGIPPRSSP